MYNPRLPPPGLFEKGNRMLITIIVIFIIALVAGFGWRIGTRGRRY